MTDKVQKILSEIATRKLCTMDEHMAFYNDKAKEDYWLLSEIEEFIKASQEESVSEDLEVELKNYLNSDEYINTLGVSGYLLVARHFANWQKEKMEKEYSDLNKGLVSAKGVAVYMAYETGKKDIIGNVRSILNKVAYRNNGLDVNGDYCEQPYVELDNEFKKLLKEK